MKSWKTLAARALFIGFCRSEQAKSGHGLHGYTEEARELVSVLTGLPLVLSSAFMAKLIAEWCS
ncbi:hypothetical protein [Brevibacillus parabrevis]|uniref:hypothetical protein n=1 Tax=Brevibacillus parabrevis TaxID=54914 RepID=UPI000A4963F5|nr:hypothetical protein [Brevibacillus parabrevis]